MREVLGLDDVVFDLSITPNRPDAMGIVGVARDLAAHFGLPFRVEEHEPAPIVDDVAGAHVLVEAPDRCPRFVALAATVTMGPSPAWMQRRLTLAGMRPISNVVDVTNYVMLERCRPLHAYDLGRLAGRGIVVRLARDGETMTTLDGVERALTDADLLICDGERVAQGIAGIMGGAAAEVSETTTEILLESAHFEASGIARSSKRLGLRSEASARFERGVDPNNAGSGAARAMELFAEVAGAEPVSGAIDVYPEPIRPARIRVRTERVNEVLGVVMTVDEVAGYLTKFGIETEGSEALVPTFRPDIDPRDRPHRGSRARLRAAERHPHRPFEPGEDRRPDRTAARPARGHRRARGRGLRRGIHAPAPGAGRPDERGPLGRRCDRGREPVTRRGVDPAARAPPRSAAAQSHTTQRGASPTSRCSSPAPCSRRRPAVSSCHANDVRSRSPGHTRCGASRTSRTVPSTSYDATAALAALAQELRVADLQLVAASVDGFHPTRAARVIVDGREVGVVGEVAAVVVDALALAGPVVACEIDVDALLAATRVDRVALPVSRFPASSVDLAFVVDDTVPAAALHSTLVTAGGPLLEDVALFDVFRSDALGPGKVSLAFGLRFRALDRTLTDDEVSALRGQCIDVVRSAHGAEFRG